MLQTRNKKFSVMVALMICLSSASLSSCNTITFNGISTTIGSLYDFTKRIVGDQLEVITILGENESHDFQPNSPQIAAKTESARLLVAYGQNVDSYAKNMISSEKYFEATSNVTFFKTTNDDGTSSNVTDPHAWLSIKDAMTMLESIKDKVIEIDSDNKAIYESNYEVALNEFKALDELYSSVLSVDNIKTNIFVTSHEAFAYLARDYGLVQHGLADIADNEPISAQIAQVVSYIHNNDIHYICLEELDNPGYVNTVIRELKHQYPNYNIETVELKAYEGVDINSWADEDNYISVMKENLIQLAKTLGNTSYTG